LVGETFCSPCSTECHQGGAALRTSNRAGGGGERFCVARCGCSGGSFDSRVIEGGGRVARGAGAGEGGDSGLDGNWMCGTRQSPIRGGWLRTGRVQIACFMTRPSTDGCDDGRPAHGESVANGVCVSAVGGQPLRIRAKKHGGGRGPRLFSGARFDVLVERNRSYVAGVTGPTGKRQDTTLYYAARNTSTKPGVNVIPAAIRSIRMDGFTQVQVIGKDRPRFARRVSARPAGFPTSPGR